MKNLKTFIAVLAISISAILPASANTTEPENAKTILRTEIVNLLGNHEYQLKKEVLKAQVSVMLNNKNELVVISVSSDDELVTEYVTAKLNYKKIDAKGIAKGTVFRVPLKMVQSS